MTPLRKLHHIIFIVSLWVAPGLLIWIWEAI